MAMKQRSNGELPTPGSIGDFMIRALQAHPEGIQRADIPRALRELGFKGTCNLNSVSAIVLAFPNIFKSNGTGLYTLHPKAVHAIVEVNGAEVAQAIATAHRARMAPMNAPIPTDGEPPMSPEEAETHLRYAVRSNEVLRRCVLMLLDATEVMPTITAQMVGVRE